MIWLYRRIRALFAPGLSWQQRLRLIPFVGPIAVWTHSIVMLNTIRHSLAQDLDQLRRRQDHSDANVKHALDQLDEQRTAMALQRTSVDARLAALAQQAEQFDALQINPRLLRVEAIDALPRFERLEVFARATTDENLARDNRIASIRRELRRTMDAMTDLHVPSLDVMDGVTAARTQHDSATGLANTDSFYIDFEDMFRGTREDISGRLTVYLPYVEKFIGDDTAHAIDVGCGRGEWLQLLTARGIKATGIDLNAAMVDACHDLGLQAVCTDAIDYLRQQPEGSIAVVTGFHIIEHLPFKTLLALFDAALRALRPDGMIIFETPNPENIMVGACNFYYDPTHIHPIVPVVAQFMAHQRGFAHAEIVRLHPVPDNQHVMEDSEVAKRFNAALYGPQDYAVLAWKTRTI